MNTFFKKHLNLIISILALFCFVSMYMPVIAPRYPAAEYYAPGGNYSAEYYFTGDYYFAREYWSMTRFVFANDSVLFRIVLSLDQALLMLWAMMSVRGHAGRNGLVIALFNLAVVGFVLFKMFAVMGSCRWGVTVVLILDALAAVVMAANVGNDFRRSPSVSAGPRDPASRRSANRAQSKK